MTDANLRSDCCWRRCVQSRGHQNLIHSAPDALFQRHAIHDLRQDSARCHGSGPQEGLELAVPVGNLCACYARGGDPAHKVRRALSPSLSLSLSLSLLCSRTLSGSGGWTDWTEFGVVTSFPRHVRGSNHCLIGVYPDRLEGRAIIVSVIDNLVKGASGQALQNMNLMLGLPEDTGLMQIAMFP